MRKIVKQFWYRFRKHRIFCRVGFHYLKGNGWCLLCNSRLIKEGK